VTDTEVMVVGGGLAGAEAAWQLARAGLRVCLLEMRPVRRTPVHTGDRLAELVCSNSLRGDAPSNAVGLLKQEMARLDSLVIGSARAAAVPAGGALAVDREGFAASVTEAITRHRRIRLERRELTELPQGPAILATGPLTSPPLAEALTRELGESALAFFDAIAPIIADDSSITSACFAPLVMARAVPTTSTSVSTGRDTRPLSVSCGQLRKCRLRTSRRLICATSRAACPSR